eukprot:NODE_14_length_51535_cov_1.125049.p1 type:complete len:873 gc:universal NODE_14_length_51535_cov_1.125049:36859-39477(+)
MVQLSQFSSLKDSDPYVRHGAIEQLLQNELSSEEKIPIIEFLIGRVEDTLSVDLILNFLAENVELIDLNNMNRLMKELSAVINVQSNPYNTRKNIYIIFQHKFKSKNLTTEFIDFYVQSIDGEKDPRNLVIIFQITSKLLKNIDTSKTREQLYEITSCYFPITFTNESDLELETKLKSLLENILSSPHFASLTIELVMEKLELNPSPSLSLLYKTLDKSHSIPHMDKLQSILFQDIFVRSRADSIPAITKLVDNFQPLLEIVITKAMENIIPPDSRNARLACELLSRCCNCPENCTNIITKTSAVFCSIYDSNSDDTFKSAVLDRIEEILYGIRKCTSFQVTQVVNFKDRFLDAVYEALNSEFGPLRLSAYSCLNSMLLIKNYIVSTNIHVSLLTLCEGIKDSESYVQEYIVKCLSNLANMFPAEFEQSGGCLEFLFNFLEDQDNFSEDIILELSDSVLADNVIMHILNRVISSKQLDDTIFCCELLCHVFKSKYLKSKTQNNVYSKITCILIDLFLNQPQLDAYHDLVFELFMYLCCSCSNSSQMELLQHFLQSTNFSVNGDLPSPSSLHLAIYAGLLCGMKSYDSLESSEGRFILPHFKRCVLTRSDYDAIILSNILNKSSVESVSEFLNTQEFQQYFKRLINDSVQVETSIKTISWIFKGLCLRCHPQCSKLLQHFILGISNDQGELIAKQFDFIFSDSVGVSTLNYCKIRSFASQKLFSSISDDLLDYKSKSHEYQKFYLIAIYGFLNNISENIVIMEMEKLYPVLIDGLEVADLQIKALRILEKSAANALDSEILDLIIEKLLSLVVSVDLQVKLSSLYTLKTLGDKHNPLRFKKQIVEALKPLLDDRKRIVRDLAIKVRYAYILMH